MTFELRKKGKVVGYEHHVLQEFDYTEMLNNDKNIRIKHSSNIDGVNSWNIMEFKDHSILHDEKILVRY